MGYHPNFFDKDEKSHRERGQLDIRLKLIENTNLGGTMLDVGCSGGYNSFALAKYFDSIYAFDMVPELIADAKKIALENKTNNLLFNMENLTENIKDLTKYDTILYLSTHHHVVGQNGIKKGGEILSKLFNKCNKVMFLDMGQKDEMCAEHRWWNILPFEKSDMWTSQHIETYTNIKPEKIGHTIIHNTKRFLWKIERQ